MTRVVFENATIADAITKASRVAPVKGSAFDKSAGIIIEVQPGKSFPIVIRATDTEVFYTEWVDAVAVEGDAVTWRLPSTVLAQLLKALPIGTGKQVVFEQDGRQIKISSGRARGKLLLMTMGDYPIWVPFDPTNLQEVDSLGEKLARAEWAADASGVPPLGCVRLDGETVIATDRSRFALAPLKLTLKEPILIRPNQITSIITRTGPVLIGMQGSNLLVMPDEHTQIRTTTYGSDYPRVERVMKRDKPNTVKVNKSDLLELINLVLTMAGSERYPELVLHVGLEEVAGHLSNKNHGIFGDVIDVPGQADHKRIAMSITPKFLTDALSQAPNNQITIGYDVAKPLDPIHLYDGSGFESWLGLRKPGDS